MFARQAVHWMRIAVEGLPDAIQEAKISAVSRFSSQLRRLTSLNHLAREARPILSNTTVIQQMMIDLNKIDFNKIQVKILEMQSKKFLINKMYEVNFYRKISKNTPIY